MPQGDANGNQSKRLQLNSDRPLPVEGRDEFNLFSALIKHCLGSQLDIQIISEGGKDQFLYRLRAVEEYLNCLATHNAIALKQ